MLLQHLELITNLQVHATPKEAGTAGKTNFSSKIMCSVQFLLCTWMTLMPDEPSALGFAGDSKTTDLSLKKIWTFQLYLWRTIRNRDSNAVDFSLRSGNGRERKYIQTPTVFGRYPAHALARLSHLSCDFCWMKMIHRATGHSLPNH